MSGSDPKYVLKLYVAGSTLRSILALRTLESLLQEKFEGKYVLNVIDVEKEPHVAEIDKVVATPTLTKLLPLPIRSIIGDFSNHEKVLLGLDLLHGDIQDDSVSSEQDESDLF